jgi:outer membrane protein OmpA-like peptidoglycan-associated protein
VEVPFFLKPALPSKSRTRIRRLSLIALVCAAALLLPACAASRHAGLPRSGREARSGSDALARALAAIDGAAVARPGDVIRVTLDSDTLFGSDSAMLRLEAERTIEEIARALLRYPASAILVAAHTDSIGRGEYKTRMTGRQALSIGEFLVDTGVPPSRIEIRGMGDLEPVAPNSAPEGRRANRRITIDILPETASEKR